MASEANCDPATLASAAACFCFNEKQSREITIYLLAQIARNTMTPSELAEAASCYCYDQKTAEAIIAYLLCQLTQE